MPINFTVKLVKKNPNGFGAIGIVAVAAVLIVLVGGWYLAYQRFAKSIDNGRTACSTEAALCPDSKTYVSRTGPNCEFETCYAPKSYNSQEECEQATRAKCDFGMCDIIPLGKTVDEVCGKGFRKGWMPINTSAQGEIDTSNWKTYRNEQYGFEVRYPDHWSVQASQAVIEFQEKGSTVISVVSGNLTVMGVTFCGAYPQDQRCERLASGITIDWGTSNPSALVSKGGEVGIFFTLHSTSSEAKGLFRQILSTFKFIK